MKTACVIFSNRKKYDKIHKCAVQSFKKFHPDIELFDINTSNINILPEEIKNSHIGKIQYEICAYLYKKHNLNKIILLGADTITCSRLDEFLNDNENHILTTLDYPYRLVIGPNLILSNSSEDHVNSDVGCFNSVEPLEKILQLWHTLRTEYQTQACLNYFCNIDKRFKVKIVDGDFENSNVVYNARAKGNLCAAANTSPWFKYTSKFKVIDGKLYTGTHENISKSKQIKVWHYCDGLGNYHNEFFENKINSWINDGFNQETKDFFANECDCGDFFKQKFII